ncbi:hypothetical protein MLD38_005516 [Melastoma candidum]|uniref:Uncharacterized protein n=1 Tax=Melastoma candidum TaxID=119954 RepID=A0ACB9RNK8_9MYRT|nr:hypothetical protein MLD38_005516 [Melastoma candidum]
MLALILGVNLQCLLDLVVAGISLAIGLGFFAFVVTVLCSAAFLLNSKKEDNTIEVWIFLVVVVVFSFDIVDEE